jgi:23S rRNA (guanosine2251-2'-O)-methyltransferase
MENQNERQGLIIGRNAVAEALKSGRAIDCLLVAKGERGGSVGKIIGQCRDKGIVVKETDKRKLDKICEGENHQGVAAWAAVHEYSTVEDILANAESKGEQPFIVICDEIEDPHNLGAVIRCAECSGAHGVIIPERRACGLTPAVSKASAGAILHMAVAKVGNIAETIEKLKENNVWTFAAEADGQDFFETDWDCGCAIVLGGEDSGVSRLVRERCDYTVSIPMYGKVNSLNVSTAASVLLCHAARMQRK